MFHRAFFNDIATLHQEMSEQFPRFNLHKFANQTDHNPDSEVRPRLNLYLTDTGYLLEAALPGIDEKSIDVSLTENILTLAAEQTVAGEIDDERQWHRRERSSGKYVRQIELPDNIEASGIQAECRQGILRVTLPKAEAALPKKISVQVN